MTIIGWCFGCMEEGGAEHAPCGPVWPMIRVRTQEELEANAPKLLQIEAPGHVLEWVPGRGRLNLTPHLLPSGRAGNCVDIDGDRWHAPGSCPDCPPPIRWLRISADPDGPPVDLADVRAVVGEAREAGVPVWIEGLGSRLRWRDWLSPGPKNSFRFTSVAADPDGWPADLRDCRKLPEVSP